MCAVHPLKRRGLKRSEKGQKKKKKKKDLKKGKRVGLGVFVYKGSITNEKGGF